MTQKEQNINAFKNQFNNMHLKDSGKDHIGTTIDILKDNQSVLKAFSSTTYKFKLIW